jgi:hypothetical protein
MVQMVGRGVYVPAGRVNRKRHPAVGKRRVVFVEAAVVLVLSIRAA